MSNTFDIFKYGLLNFGERSKDTLFGEKQSVQPGQDTMRRSEQGYLNKSLKYAGGAIDETLFGKPLRTKHPTEGVLVGAGGVPQRFDPNFDVEKDKWISQGRVSEGLINKTAKKSIEITKKAVVEGENYLENQIQKYFPNFAGNDSISIKEKKALIEGAEKGKVDHALLQAVKDKTDPINEKDIGTLEKLTGVDFDKAKANWKDKGGMDGLMSNPAFSLGLALMQSSANGKTINQGILDNFIKSAKISEHYQDRIKAKTQVFGPPSQDERDFAQAALSTIGMTGPGKWSKGWDFVKLWGKDNQAAYNRGLNTIVVQAKKEIDKKYKGKSHTVTEEDYVDAFNILKSQGKIKDMKTLFGVTLENINKNKSLTSKGYDWLKKKIGSESEFYKAEGGPVSAGKPYMVGEQGPEIIIPRSDGDVLTNDDSQIYAMLLASNPQLQKVSRVRAQKIMRNRFPEYFEG